MNVVLGFVLILLMGFIGSRLTLFRGELSLGLQYILFAGTEFLFVGLILGPYVTNVLSEATLQQLAPILSLGLGWIGLLIGLQFDLKTLRSIHRSIFIVAFVISLVCFVLVFSGLYLIRDLFLSSVPGPLRADESLFIYPELGKFSFCFILGWVATESTYSALALIKRSTDARGETTKMLQLLSDIRTPIAFIAMGIWYCVFHVSNVANVRRWSPAKIISLQSDSVADETAPLWSDLNLPEQMFIPPIMTGFMWLFVTILLGIVLGWMLHYLTSKRLQGNELLLVLTGSVIFSSGLAAYLQLSPLFVNFVMGATLTNLPNFARGRVSNMMIAQEKPFFVIFMILVGAMWPIVTPMVLVFTLFYCLLRLLGLSLGTISAIKLFIKDDRPYYKRLGYAMLPQGAVAIALVTDYILIYPSRHADLVFGIVILAVLVNQLLGPVLLTSVLRKSGDIGEAPAATQNNS